MSLRSLKMNSFVATFFTHYGAIKFHNECKNRSVESKMAPVPRRLASSCGTCVFFTAGSPSPAAGAEDLEACYLLAGGEYVLMTPIPEKNDE